MNEGLFQKDILLGLKRVGKVRTDVRMRPPSATLNPRQGKFPFRDRLSVEKVLKKDRGFKEGKKSREMEVTKCAR